MIRLFAFSFFLGSMLSFAHAQTGAAIPAKPVVEVLRFSWSIQPQSNLETGMMGASGAGPQRPDQVNANREIEILRQQAAGDNQKLKDLEQKQKRDQLPTLANPKRPEGKVAYKYTVEVKNNSDKQIAEVEWDYIFTNPKTSQEALRHSFKSKVKIKPDKKATISVISTVSPYQVINVTGIADKKAEQVIIKRIVYSDKSEWKS